MTHIIIDRRPSHKKSSTNRQKFLKRSKAAIKEHVDSIIADGNIKDVAKRKKDKIKISKKKISEPRFTYDSQTGTKEWVLPGNDQFIAGDRVKKPQKDGKGSQASNSGDGEDDFIFTISQKEFLEYFFEDLELPDLTKKAITSVVEQDYKRAGFSTVGNPNRLDLLRSMKYASGRRAALRAPKRRKIRELEDQLQQLKEEKADRKQILFLEDQIETLKRKLRAVPFIDNMDLQYRQWDTTPVPITQACMVCVMDVSGSMGQQEKDLAKRFFMLLYLFLTRNYEKIDIVFVRHHTTAKEVNEEDFFYSKETGGTLVSSAIELTKDIIETRYPSSSWNTYICQASDGDNWLDDNTKVDSLLSTILPNVQHHFYVELTSSKHREMSELMQCYSKLKERFSNLETVTVQEASEIWPVFRNLFKKQYVK